MVIDAAGSFEPLPDCWFPLVLNLAEQQVTPQELQDVTACIHEHVFNEALRRSDGRMNVTRALREFIPNHPDWTGSPLMPLYENTGMDEVHAARVYGNLVCRIGVRSRQEVWWCFPEPVAEDHFSRTYVIEDRVREHLRH